MMNVRISSKAFMKMQTLVMGYDKEVGWFGFVERIADADFRIKDIIVFPQYTSAAYIDDEQDDPLEFCKWLDTLSDEEYVERRLWGHSHVNMAVSPSGVDTDMFERFAKTNASALENRFAICVIINKKGDMFWWAYDAENEKEYLDKDINIIFEVDDGISTAEFFEDSRNLVRDIRRNKPFILGGGTISRTMSKYNSPIMNKSKDDKKDKKKEAVTQTPVSDALKDIVGEVDSDEWGYGYDWDNYEDYHDYLPGAFQIEMDEDSIAVKEVSISEIRGKDAIWDSYGNIYNIIGENKKSIFNRIKNEYDIRYFNSFELIEDNTGQVIPIETVDDIIDLHNEFRIVNISEVENEDGTGFMYVHIEKEAA